jgi:predicted amidophosphoribosyltransferase
MWSARCRVCRLDRVDEEEVCVCCGAPAEPTLAVCLDCFIANTERSDELRRLKQDMKSQFFEHRRSPEYLAHLASEEAERERRSIERDNAAASDEEIRRKLPRQNYEDDT